MLGIFAGVYFWFPKMFGRKMNDRLGRTHFWLTFVPMITIFLLMHMQGFGGMLRRSFDATIYDYNAANTGLRVPITLTAFILFCGQVIFLWNFFRSIRKGEKVGENPWEATTLEWNTPSPAPHGNFGAELPVVHRWPYEYSLEEGDRDYIPQAEGGA